MRGAIHPIPQYALMAWCSVQEQGQFTFTFSTDILTRILLISHVTDETFLICGKFTMVLIPDLALHFVFTIEGNKCKPGPPHKLQALNSDKFFTHIIYLRFYILIN
jgi:hypothetical protein